MQKFTYGSVEGIERLIHRFYPWLSVYIYYVDGLLIDTGPGIGRARMARKLKQWDIEKVAITHRHRDHSGMVPWITRHFDVPIYMDSMKSDERTFIETFFSGGYSAKTEPYPDMIRTKNFAFRPINTPGHTIEHTCLYERERGWLFTGDLYVTPRPKVYLRSESIDKYITSLKHVLKLDFETVFCAHQGVLKNGRQLLEEKLDYLETIQSEVIELHETGHNERMITKKLFPKKARLERVSLGMFSSIHLVRSCLQESDGS